MAQLVLENVDAETAEKLELRAKRLGTTPEEEALRLLREHLLAEPHRELGSAAKTPAIIGVANAVDPELMAQLQGLETELAALKSAYVESPIEARKSMSDPREMEQTPPDPRFEWKHGLLVFTGELTAEQIPDHRVLRDERVDVLLRGIDEGRV